MDVLESFQPGATKVLKGLELVGYERVRELPLFSLVSRRLRMTFMCVNTCWMGRKIGKARVLVVPNDRQRGNRHKLKSAKFQFLIRKLFFSVYMIKHRDSLWRLCNLCPW